MTEALVNPELLRWARERTRLDVDVFAHKMGTRVEKVCAWESGESRPTFKQAQKFANVTHVPFGYLFLPEPPEQQLPIPDLRTVGKNAEPLSADFYDLVQNVIFKQDWYRDYLREQGAKPLPFVGQYSLQTPVAEVAQAMAKTMGADVQLRQQVNNGEEYLRALMKGAEAVGILVMRSGVVGNNSCRQLNVAEFRGFTINDPWAPLVFINGKDAKAAQIFTLAHELAHIWIGQSGISNPSLGDPEQEGQQDVEYFCNSIAAELLVPQREFFKIWRTNYSIDENADVLARYFKISRVVVARRAFDLGQLLWDEYQDYFQDQVTTWKKRDNDSGSSGGDYYRTSKIRNGERFTRTVLSSAFSGRLLMRDAGKLLGVKPAKLKNLAAKINME